MSTPDNPLFEQEDNTTFENEAAGDDDYDHEDDGDDVNYGYAAGTPSNKGLGPGE